MKMRARVRVTLDIDLPTQVPELEHDQAHPRARTGQPGQIAGNEADVLEARRGAARDAERIARETYPDAVDVLVEEVTEA